MLEEISKVMPIVQTIGIPLLGYGAYLLRDIRDELRRLNGRVVRLEQWREDHEIFADRARAEINREFDRIHDALGDN